MKIITTDRLIEMLLNYTGASFVTLVTATEPKMNQKHRETKAPNPFLGKRVLRMAERLCMIGASYENAVKNRREREQHPAADAFKAESLWNGAGEHVEGSRNLVRHKDTGKLYLVFYPYREGSVRQDTWTVNGIEVSPEELKPYLPPVSEGSKRQETERPVAWRTVALDNVAGITINGETYMVAGR
jgi:hypothetical protein